MKATTQSSSKVNALQTSWWTDDPAAREKLHREPFLIHHTLAHLPLFEIPQLIQVAREAVSRPGDVYYDSGDPTLADKWGKIPIPEIPVDEVIERIETAKAWIIVKHAEKDPHYGAVLDECTDFVRGVAGAEGAKSILNPEMLIIVSSPNRITPFHFDAEINFLVQVRGSKQVWICDPDDRSVVSERDIEEYYMGNITAGQFRPEFTKKARHIELKPGQAVHIPTHAAHWVQNNDEISVSLSLNFEFPHWRKDLYRANYHLRKLGLQPQSPGKSTLEDAFKYAPLWGLQAARKLLKL